MAAELLWKLLEAKTVINWLRVGKRREDLGHRKNDVFFDHRAIVPARLLCKGHQRRQHYKSLVPRLEPGNLDPQAEPGGKGRQREPPGMRYQARAW